MSGAVSYVVTAYIVTAYIVTAYVVMAYIVMAYIVMARRERRRDLARPAAARAQHDWRHVSYDILVIMTNML